jgi:uncharacterized protein YqiB (DUF1249 family)
MWRRGRLRRLERQRRSETVSIEQRDGTLAVFDAPTFWLRLFLDAVDAAKGELADSTVVRALQGATPAARERMTELIRDQGGQFLSAYTDDWFATVEEPPPDLSEPAQRDEVGF